jgi:uncharacterized protein (DUF433 family)
MIDWSNCPAVERDPDRVSDAWVFRGTRVPVTALFENLEDGVVLSDFVQWFPGVTLEQARAVLEYAARRNPRSPLERSHRAPPTSQSLTASSTHR